MSKRVLSLIFSNPTGSCCLGIKFLSCRRQLAAKTFLHSTSLSSQLCPIFVRPMRMTGDGLVMTFHTVPHPTSHRPVNFQIKTLPLSSFSCRTPSRASSQFSQLAQTEPLASRSVLASAKTTRPLRARVIATFARRVSRRNPKRPDKLARTAENSTRSASAPWKPSTVET